MNKSDLISAISIIQKKLKYFVDATDMDAYNRMDMYQFTNLYHKLALKINQLEID